MARIFGIAACAGSAAVVVAAVTVGRQTPGLLPVIGFFGLLWAALGAWMLFAAARMSRFRAIVTPAALRLTASQGRSIWFQGASAEAIIPWPEVQGFSRADTPNPAAQGGAQSSYILYTKEGDFSLNSLQWENLDGLIQQIAKRTGHGAGEVASERAAAQTELRSSERRMRSIQRVFGWIVLITSGLLLLPVLGTLFSTGMTADTGKAAIFLLFAMGVAASVIRFYRRR